MVLMVSREYLGDTREPFALTTGGTKLYFLTDSSDVASMYKNTVTLDFMAIVKPLITMFGMSKAGMDLAFQVPPSAAEDPVNIALQLSNDKPKSKTFHPDRWLAKDVPGKKDHYKPWGPLQAMGTTTSHGDHYKPWGGGITFCPGRFLAKSTIRSFLAIAVARYDIQLEPGQVEAKFKLDEPVNGPVYPVEGMDVKLRLRPKY